VEQREERRVGEVRTDQQIRADKSKGEGESHRCVENGKVEVNCESFYFNRKENSLTGENAGKGAKQKVTIQHLGGARGHIIAEEQ